jgi:hypothetical protein
MMREGLWFGHRPVMALRAHGYGSPARARPAPLALRLAIASRRASSPRSRAISGAPPISYG